MTDRWTITCGVCGLIGPEDARSINHPPVAAALVRANCGHALAEIERVEQ